jgi:hypothetical protein
MIKRIAIAAVPLAAAAALAMSGVAQAQAAATPLGSTDGTIGYQAVQDVGGATYFTHVIGQFGLGNPQYLNTNPTLQVDDGFASYLGGLTPGVWSTFDNTDDNTVDAARIGLCGGVDHVDAGITVQEVIVPVSPHSYDVVAFSGQFNGPGDDCLDSALPSGSAAVLLEGVPTRDTVQLDVIYDGANAHNGATAGNATFVANDLSSPSSASIDTSGTSTPFPTADNEFYEADAGVIGAEGAPRSSLAGDVLPDSKGPHLVVKLAHVQLNGNNLNNGREVRGTLQSDAAWKAVPVTYHHNGDIAGAVSVFKADHFSVYTAPGALEPAAPPLS